MDQRRIPGKIYGMSLTPKIDRSRAFCGVKSSSSFPLQPVILLLNGHSSHYNLEAWIQSIQPCTTIAGFREVGVCPFDPTAI